MRTLDDSRLIHEPSRFLILTEVAKAPGGRIPFTQIRDAIRTKLGINDDAVSYHVGRLADAGLLACSQIWRGPDRGNWLTRTPRGNAALAALRAELDAIDSSEVQIAS